jgi:protein FrlC
MPQLRREQIAAMNLHYMLYPFEYFLKTQQELGVRTIEMWCGAPHFLLDDETYQDCDEVKKMVEGYGLDIAVFTPECAVYPYPLCAWDDYAYKKALEYYKKGLEAAGKLGARFMLTNCCGGAFDQDYEIAFDRAVKALRELGPVAADNGVTLAVETVRPEESCVITKLPELKRLLGEVSHPNVKAALDTCAMGVANETIEEWFATLGKDIVHMHFIDGRPYGHMVWGEGLHPLDDFIRVLNENDYQGYLGQELTVRDYYLNPAQVDRKNMNAFEPYLL